MWANESPVGGPHERAARAAPSGTAPDTARRALSLAIALSLAAWASPALAVCTPRNATMTFTNYSPFGAGVAATATIAYTCRRTGTATIAISPARTMTSGASTLPFELYTDAARSTAFPGSPALPIPASSGSVTVYAFLRPQDVAPGTYTTRLTVTITSDGRRTRTAGLNVTTTFAGTCSIQPGALAFGAYDPLSTTPADATGTIGIACTRTTRYTVGLGAGNNAAGATRRMAGPGGGLLQYELYSDPARSSPWDAVRTVGGAAPSIAPVPLVVHGRIPAGQRVPAGDYADVVQSTINF